MRLTRPRWAAYALIMGRCWTGYTSISGGRAGMTHSYRTHGLLTLLGDTNAPMVMASSRLKCHQKKYAGCAVYGVRNVRWNVPYLLSLEECVAMKIVILGAGALGTVLGAHLARAGEDVTLIARGQRAAYLQEHGATLTGLVDFTVPVRVVTDPQQVHEADVLMVTVKTYDMVAALASVKHLDVG